MANVKNNPKLPKQSKPKRINKHYWLDKGYEMVDGGLKRSQEQINSIKTYINGLLGIYVIASIIDTIYIEIDNFWKLLIVILPVILVKWAVYYGEISTLPEVKSFYPDSADSSEETYYQYLNEAQKHIKKLKNFAFGSTIILLATLTLVTWWTVQSKTKTALDTDKLKIAKSELKETQEKLINIEGRDIYELTTKISGKDTIYVEGILPKNKFIFIELMNKKDSIIFPKKKIYIGKSGRLYYDFNIKKKSTQNDSLFIVLNYTLNEFEKRRIKKLVLLNEKKN